jgi:hypothetical protein
MRLARILFLAAAALPFAGCGSSTSSDDSPAILLTETFDNENGGVYALNYEGFAQWDVTGGTVDLVGTAPFDDFLPTTQRLYVDLDGTTRAGGTLVSKTAFVLTPGMYRLSFKMAGTPRPSQPDNTVIVSVGTAYRQSLTLQSYAPLRTYVGEFEVDARQTASVSFQQLGGDDYGNFIDDIVFERL